MTEQAPKKRVGRPPLPEGQLKGGSNLTFRARDGLREQLRLSAEAAGRSLSEEIEYRLNRAYQFEEAYGSARELLNKAEADANGNIMAAMHRLGWGKMHGTEFGTVWIEPGTHNLPRSGFVEVDENGKAGPQPRAMLDLEPMIANALRRIIKPEFLKDQSEPETK